MNEIAAQLRSLADGVEALAAAAGGDGSDALEPRVLQPASSVDANRISLYLHPDDYEWLRYEWRVGDFQLMFRSMVALCRADELVAARVAALARRAGQESRS